jgi:hypothetical protein
VDDEARFVFPFENLGNDLIERDNFHFNSGREQLERQISSGEFSRDRNFFLLDIVLGKRAG